MTIIDILLHKWNMLDDRRRKVIIGSVIIGIIILIVSVILLSRRGSSDQPQPEPTTTAPPKPITTTDLFYYSTKSPREGDNILSQDKRALASLKVTFLLKDIETKFLKGPFDFEVIEEKPGGEKFTVEFTGYHSKIICDFVKEDAKQGKKVLRASTVTLRWQVDVTEAAGGENDESTTLDEGDESKWLECSLGPSKDSGFFQAEVGKHYKCDKSIKYQCSAEGISEAFLRVDSIEIELERTQTVDKPFQFTTDAEICEKSENLKLKVD